MRANCEVGMAVILKQEENLPNPTVMSVEDYNAEKGIATCIGMNAHKHPFKIDVKTVNLEKANLKRIRAAQDK